MKKFILLILAIIIAGGGYYYFFVSNNTEVATTSYEYIKIEKGNIKKTVSATGKIIPTSTLTLSSEISGKIVEINKDFNEQINKGEVLAIFDQNPFTLSVKESQTSVDISKSKLKQKQASLEKAKSELNNSIANKYGAESRLEDSNLYLSKLEENLEERKALFDKKFISKKEFDEASTFIKESSTVILPVKNHIVHPSILADDGTLGLRMPHCDFPIALCAKLGFPITTTSINRTGQPPLSDPKLIKEQFDSEIDLIIDFHLTQL